VRGSAPGDGTWTGLPVIFDEVFVGLHRLGLESSGPLLGANPDISVHAKALTGGLIPLAVTLANESIFKAFLSENKADALLHGHSYSAHAIGCEVANETLDMMTQMKESESWLLAQDAWQKDDGSKPIVWSFWDPEFIKVLSTLPQVTEVKTMGTVLAFKTADEGGM
jgi:bifunctional dethiobiotin synthetase / adenosylmethionine---8-amino-7-oxononanoate aminotransferase